MKPKNGKGKGGGRKRNGGREGIYKKIPLFYLSICSAVDGQTARPNGLKFGG